MRLWSSVVAWTVAGACAFAAPLTPGNLLVSVVGEDGRNSALTSSATSVLLREYTLTGVLVQTITLPSSGTNTFTLSGTNHQEGAIRCHDGRFSLIGYRANAGTATVARTNSNVIPRALLVLTLDGTPSTSGHWTDAYGSDGTVNALPRSALATAARVWATGTGSFGGGLRTAPTGQTTSAEASPSLTRLLRSWNGRLFASDKSGILELNPDWPVGATNPSCLPGFPDPSAAEPSTQDFAFADSDTLYVADDRPASGTTGGDPNENGIRKYRRINSVWVFQYRLQSGLPPNGSGASAGARTFDVAPSGSGNHTLYVVSVLNSANPILTCVDTGPFSTFQPLCSAANFQAFRGVCIIPSSSVRQVTGTLDFGDGFAGTTPQTVLLTIKDAGGIVLQTAQVSVIPNQGRAPYSLSLNGSVTGSFRLLAKTTTFLTESSPMLSASGSPVADLTLRNGDCDGDDVVSVFDYIRLSDAFDASIGDPGYDLSADLDQDGQVSVFDYILLSDQFDSIGNT